MARKFVKIGFVLAMLVSAAAGLRHAQGQRDGESISRNAFTATTASSRTHVEIKIDSSDGSFILKNLTLTRMMGSTVLKGNIVNRTKRRRAQVHFAVEAYDRDGRLLKGLESETIFTAQGLKANASTPINHGYGVWLQGVSLDDIARLEISELGKETGRSTLARMIPLASHALDLQRYSEIEE
jgi:hypothetical protein